MKMMVFALLMLGSVAANATYIPNDCPLKIAGWCFTQSEAARFLANSNTAGGGVVVTATVTVTNTVTGFRLQNGTAWQVPAGTTATCRAFRTAVGAGSALASHSAILSYSDTTVPQDNGTFGTNVVFYGGTNTFYAFVYNQEPTENILVWKIPASKYPTISVNSAITNTTAWCLID